MKCKIPEISWHNRDPVLSVDIQPNCDCTSNKNEKEIYRLATGGTDAHVLIWYMHLNTTTSELELELAADLTRHQRAVNAVKWSPNGQLLASGDDESVIFIWKQKEESECLNILENTNDDDKEIWLTMKVLRGHMEDVYDLSWSPNSELLVSGSVDNTAIIWNVQKGKSMAILSDHKGFVQGVSWDPLNQYIATLSTDSYLRIFDIQTRKVIHRVNKSTLPVPQTHELYDKRCRLYYDDTLQTFFRRLCFTPDGKLLITPAGVVEYEDATHPLNTSYIFSRYALKQPAILLPSPEQYTVAVGCCPLLFKLREHTADNPPVIPLSYRMIFAIATRCSVYFYDTQQLPPFAVISNIHYTRLTDITWSHNGRIVVVSSTDGFCSLITFDAEELGAEYVESEKENVPDNQMATEANSKDDEKSVTKNMQMNIPEIILDKEILSSADKFQTPAKKSVSATVIAIRRHPRPTSEIYGKEISKKVVSEKKEDEQANEKTESKLEPQISQLIKIKNKELADEKVDSISIEEKITEDDQKQFEKESMEIQKANEENINIKLIEQVKQIEDQPMEIESESKELTEQNAQIDECEQEPKPEEGQKEENMKVSSVLNTEERKDTKQDKIQEVSKKEVKLETENNKRKMLEKEPDENMEVDESHHEKEIQNAQIDKCEQEQKSEEGQKEENMKVSSVLNTDKREERKDTKQDKIQEVSKEEVKLETENNKIKMVEKEPVERMEQDKSENEKEIEKNVTKESAIKNSAANEIVVEKKTDLDHEPLSAEKVIKTNQKYLSPNERTPRRVALRTISTPKSKKKLLD